MFGLKLFNNTKSKNFKSDKSRKKYFAIKNNYAAKVSTTKQRSVKKPK